MQGKSQPPPARSYQAVMQQNAGTATRAECLQPWSSAVPLGWACPMLLCIWKEKLVPNTDPRYCELTELLVVPCLQPGHKKQEERSQPPAGTSELLLQLCWQEHRLQGSKNLLEARMEQRLHRASSPSLLSIFSSNPRSCASSRCPRSPLGEKLCQGDSSTRLLAGNATDCSDSGSVSVREVEDLLYWAL